MKGFWITVAFLYGCMLGSFVSVCICRLPIGKSIVLPPSSCGSCGSLIPMWQNIPLVSYVWLRGKCHRCGSGFSPRYFLVELLCGCLAAFLFMKFGDGRLNWTLLYYCVFTGILVIIFFIDMEHRIIPASLTDYGIIFGVTGSYFLDHPGIGHVYNAIAGALLGYVVFTLIRSVGGLIAGQEAMGSGDVALAAMMGSFLGWQNLLAAFFLAFFIGTAIQLPQVLSGKSNARSEVPFGTFLAIGSLCALFWGDILIRLYLSWPGILP